MKNSILKTAIRICCLVLVAAILLSVPAAATLPYNGYIYDAWGEAVASPVGYEPDILYSGSASEGTSLLKPSDLFIAPNGNVYISDTGHNRIIICDKDLEFIREISSVITEKGNTDIKAPSGLFVDARLNVYVALPDEGKVIMFDSTDRFVCEFTRPETDLIDDSVEFKPSKVVVNSSGTVFVLVDGLYLGSIMYDSNGEFLGFYGANDVVMTVSLLVDYYWKKLMSQKQIDKMARYVPVQYSNFDIDADNFIYTCTNDSTTTSNELCKLNAIGNNVLVQREQNVSSLTGDYGDLQRVVYKGKIQDTSFVDVCVSDDGFIFGLDKYRGRIFEYDQESKLLNVFGSVGYQKGSFQNPVALDVYNRSLYVLDGTTGCITRFQTTEYGACIEEAVRLYNEGFYSDAKELWKDILNKNTNCELAYAGIGKALYEEGDYSSAMHYFKLGYDRTGYSRAFKEYRLSIIREWFPYVITGMIILILGFAIYRKLRKHKNLPSLENSNRQKPILLQILRHPTETFQELKYHKQWSMLSSVAILVLWFISTVFNKQLTNFKFNYNNTNQFNVLYTVVATFGLMALWTVLNWAVAALMEGKGTLKEICVASSYALVPYIVSQLINVGLSHLLTTEETMFMTIISAVGILWSAFLLIDALHVIHDYSVAKTVFSIILILLGIVFVLFLCVLFFGLIQQFVMFFKTVYAELTLR